MFRSVTHRGVRPPRRPLRGREKTVCSPAAVAAGRHARWALIVAGLAAAVTQQLAHPARAYADDDAPCVVRVEEDWELVLGQPNAAEYAPQIMCVMSPVSHANGHYMVVNLNHWSLPDFNAGGIQVQAWAGETPIDWGTGPDYSVLATDAETITWTNRMDLSGGAITYCVENGSSTTWGSFGGQGYLRADDYCSLESLNGYSADVSVANSQVTYGSHRVQSLVIREVRRYTSDGHVYVDSTPRVVYQHVSLAQN